MGWDLRPLNDNERSSAECAEVWERGMMRQCEVQAMGGGGGVEQAVDL